MTALRARSLLGLLLTPVAVAAGALGLARRSIEIDAAVRAQLLDLRATMVRKFRPRKPRVVDAAEPILPAAAAAGAPDGPPAPLTFNRPEAA